MNGELNISKEMKVVKSDIQDILACYRSKPNVQFKHVQCDYNGHHIDFSTSDLFIFSSPCIFVLLSKQCP